MFSFKSVQYLNMAALPPSLAILIFFVESNFLFRTYTGSPIGTTYTVSVFPTENPEERLIPNKACMINMVIWLTEAFPKIMDIQPIVSLRKVNKIFNGEIKLQVYYLSIYRSIYLSIYFDVKRIYD